MTLPLVHMPTPADLDRKRGIDAYRLMSFTPEKRADGDIAGYVKDVLAFAELLEAHASTPDKITEAVAQVERYRLRYIEWEYTLWSAKGRTASPMITGPARFPVSRNEKAMNAERRKVEAYLAWSQRTERAALKAVQQVGYVAPPKPEGAPSGQIVTFERDGMKVVENFDMDRLQIIFSSKPDADERAVLKGEAFKWASSQNAWQRQLTDNARRAGNRIAAKLVEVAA